MDGGQWNFQSRPRPNKQDCWKKAETTMIEQQTTKLMEHYGITTEQLSVYHYAGFRYSNLSDALNYAALIASRENASNPEAIKTR